MLNRPPKKLGGGEVYVNYTETTMSCETVSEQENSHKTITDLLGKMEVPDIARMEKETNQDKKGPLPWNGCLGDPRMRPHHEDKRKNQVTTTAEKEDNTDSTATAGLPISYTMGRRWNAVITRSDFKSEAIFGFLSPNYTRKCT